MNNYNRNFNNYYYSSNSPRNRSRVRDFWDQRKSLFFLNKNNFKSKQEDSVDPFEKIIKNLRLNNNKDRKFPLRIETIEYEFEVYKEL